METAPQYDVFMDGPHGYVAFEAHQVITTEAENPDAQEKAAEKSRIDSLPIEEVRDRFHELVDKKLKGKLSEWERFQLERIDDRLDAEDRDPALEARNRQWESERTKLLDSIQELVVKLRR